MGTRGQDGAFPMATGWRGLPLFLWLAAAIALTASLALPGLWAALDTGLARALNGTIAWHENIATIWAIGCDRRFSAFLILTIFAAWLVHLGREEGEGFQHDLSLGVVAFILPLLFFALALTVGETRPAPAATLALFHAVPDLVSWSQAGANATSSLPAAHAALAGALTVTLWLAFGRAFGLMGLALLVLIALPRIAAGAEWASDTMLGAGVSALLMLALAKGTPLPFYIYRLVDVPAGRFLHWCERIIFRLSAEGRENIHPAKQVLRGMCIGASDLVPGVSGGTMALILGVYRRLIAAIAHIDGVFIGHIRRFQIIAALRHIDFLFTGPIAVGVLISLIIFSRVIPFSLLMNSFAEPTFGFFFGLVLASTLGLMSHVEIGGLRGWGWIALGFLFGLSISILVPVKTPDAAWFLFLCGMAAVFALLVPGISGAFVLLILGKYADALEALGRFDLPFILPLVAGIITGALLFSRAINWLLDHFYRVTMLTVIGVLFGSLLAVWPFKHRHYEMIGSKTQMVSAEPYFPTHLDGTVIAGAMALIAGLLLYRLLDRLAQHADEDVKDAAVSK